MTNEEIDQAAKEYSSSCNYIAITNAENGFIAGANWALTHQWHDAKKELPNTKEVVFVLTDKCCIGTAYNHGVKSGWIIYGDEAYKKFGTIVKWMPKK